MDTARDDREGREDREGRTLRKTNGSMKPSPSLMFDILAEEDSVKQIEKVKRASLDIGHSPGHLIHPMGSRHTGFNIAGADSGGLMGPSMDASYVLKELLGDLWVHPNDLREVELLGEGGFASVSKSMLKDRLLNFEEAVAVKRLKAEAFKSGDDLKDFLLEANLMRKMRHPHIVRLLGVGAQELQDLSAARKSIYLVEEFMAGGDLKHLMMEQLKSPFTPLYSKKDVLRWAFQIAEAMQYLHHVCRPMIIHRDLKLDNLLLTGGPLSEATAKLADFGLHKRVKRTANGSLVPWITDFHSVHRRDPADAEGSYYGGNAFSSTHGGNTLGSTHGGNTLGSTHGGRANLASTSPPLRMPPPPPSDPPPMSESDLTIIAIASGTSLRDLNTQDSSVHRKMLALQAINEYRANNPDSGRKPAPPSPLSTSTAATATAPLERNSGSGGSAGNSGEQRLQNISATSTVDGVSAAAAAGAVNGGAGVGGAVNGDTGVGGAVNGGAGVGGAVNGGAGVGGVVNGGAGVGGTGVGGAVNGGAGVGGAGAGGAGVLGANPGVNIKFIEGTQRVGSLLYMAPEVLLGQPYNEKVDVFAFGVILYELLTGTHLLIKICIMADNTTEEMSQYASRVSGGFRETLPSWWPPEVKGLVGECWAQDPRDRPSFSDVLSRLQEMRQGGVAEAMDTNRPKRGYNPVSDCGCAIM